jgi:hypothetical protein
MYNENVIKNFNRVKERLDEENGKHWQVVASILETSCSDDELDKAIMLMKVIHINQNICKMCDVKKEQTD